MNLTKRETEVLKYLGTDCTVREIACVMNLSPKTVDTHKTNLMRKLGVHTRAEAMQYAALNRPNQTEISQAHAGGNA